MRLGGGERLIKFEHELVMMRWETIAVKRFGHGPSKELEARTRRIIFWYLYHAKEQVLKWFPPLPKSSWM